MRQVAGISAQYNVTRNLGSKWVYTEGKLPQNFLMIQVIFFLLRSQSLIHTDLTSKNFLTLFSQTSILLLLQIMFS